MSIVNQVASQVPITPFTDVDGPDVQHALEQISARAFPSSTEVVPVAAQGVTFSTTRGPGDVPLEIREWIQVTINGETRYLPVFGEDQSDPFFNNVVLLVRGTNGFADISSLDTPPVSIGAPLSLAPPSSGWSGDTIFRFIRANLSAVSYTQAGKFLDSDDQDVTIEMFCDMDSGLSYDTGVDDRGSFLRLTDAGVLSFRYWLDNFAPLYFAAYPAQVSMLTSATGGRSHIAYCRSMGGTYHQLWVNGTRVVETLGAPVLWNFDTVRWGMGNDAVGLDRRAQGYAEELRITKAARYTGATITVPTTPLPDH